MIARESGLSPLNTMPLNGTVLVPGMVIAEVSDSWPYAKHHYTIVKVRSGCTCLTARPWPWTCSPDEHSHLKVIPPEYSRKKKGEIHYLRPDGTSIYGSRFFELVTSESVQLALF